MTQGRFYKAPHLLFAPVTCHRDAGRTRLCRSTHWARNDGLRVGILLENDEHHAGKRRIDGYGYGLGLMLDQRL